MSEFLRVDNVSFSYGNKRILNDINFQLQQGEIAALLGPSGCGKTSLLRLIAGFVTPQTGTVTMNQQVISSPTDVLSPNKRQLGMIFQDYALFPHLSIYDNIVFGMPSAQRQHHAKRVAELLELVGLPDYQQRFPHQLSGGEQQRIAIARALAPNPKLLLMDEPFASLDTNLRERLVRDLGDLLAHLNIAAILVTHDQREAFAVSEHIGLMHAGEILHWDVPYNIYHEPKLPFVANFVGQGIMLKATIINDSVVDSALGKVESHRPFTKPIGTDLCMLIRPDDIVEDHHSTLSGTVSRKFFHGADTLYEINHNDLLIVANFNSHADYHIGETVHFSVKAKHLVTFDENAAGCVC